MFDAGAPRSRGRPPAASREDVIAAATRQYRAGERIDVRAIATELGLGRATLYRWFGTRTDVVGAVLVAEFEGVVTRARAGARGRGAAALLKTFDGVNRALATAAPLRRFLEQERDGLRLLTSSAGPVQPRVVALVAQLIRDEAAAGHYTPPIDPDTLAYAVVRLFEAFIYNDAAAGFRGDLERLHDVQAVLVGATPRAA